MLSGGATFGLSTSVNAPEVTTAGGFDTGGRAGTAALRGVAAGGDASIVAVGARSSGSGVSVGGGVGEAMGVIVGVDVGGIVGAEVGVGGGVFVAAGASTAGTVGVT